MSTLDSYWEEKHVYIYMCCQFSLLIIIMSLLYEYDDLHVQI